MCDEHTARDDARLLDERGGLTRRQFGALTMGAAMAMMLPRGAHADDMVERDVVIDTGDGRADCYFVHPGSGTHPGVVVWPDILGLRPAYRQMGKRLAEAGYAVLVINPYYRSAKSPVVEPGASFGDPAVRERIMPFARSLSTETTTVDAKAFVGFLDAQKAVDTQRGLGTTGYCMGGPMVFVTAAMHPDRVRAAATFHGARLVTDSADSPHLLIPEMEADFLVAIAENDDERDPDAKDVLRRSFDAVGLPAEIEVYAGANHGWCALDSAVYNPEQAERAWGRLLALFGASLA